MRKLLLALIVASAGFGVTRPAEVHAQGSLNLSSSMSAWCLGTCNQVAFSLQVAGDVFVSNVMLNSLDATIWKFGSLFRVFDAGGVDVTTNWLSGTTASGLTLSTLSLPFSAEPLRFIVNMALSGTQSQLNHNIGYTANGYQSITPTQDGFFSASGTVTPEPATSVLFGTGLIGIAMMARRRRRKMDLRADEACGPNAG